MDSISWFWASVMGLGEYAKVEKKNKGLVKEKEPSRPQA
jgi:hypothetical protein